MFFLFQGNELLIVRLSNVIKYANGVLILIVSVINSVSSFSSTLLSKYKIRAVFMYVTKVLILNKYLIKKISILRSFIIFCIIEAEI